MLISQANAAATTDAATTAAPATTATTTTPGAVPAAPMPSATESFMSNMGLILLMFVLFYVLLIRPQQKRMKKQQEMLGALKVGDRVVTGGGLVGTISRLVNDAEVEVDLGSVKVTALRYTLTARTDPTADTASK